MKAHVPIVMCLISLVGPSDPRAETNGQPRPTITGTWLVEDADAHVEVSACGDSLCGTIVWLLEPFDEYGNEKLDIHNPDESLRRRRVMGLEVLRVSRRPRDDNAMWRGTVYDPKIGKSYNCKTHLLDGGDLKIRGFIGVSLFGRTVHWTRVEPEPSGE